jgi:hypothetical protein
VRKLYLKKCQKRRRWKIHWQKLVYIYDGFNNIPASILTTTSYYSKSKSKKRILKWRYFWDRKGYEDHLIWGNPSVSFGSTVMEFNQKEYLAESEK